MVIGTVPKMLLIELTFRVPIIMENLEILGELLKIFIPRPGKSIDKQYSVKSHGNEFSLWMLRKLNPY